jgi:Tol biopolymer transport system component
LSLGCGADEEVSDIISFPNADLHPLRAYNAGEANCVGTTWAPDMSRIVYVHEDDLWSTPPSGIIQTQLTSLEGVARYPNWCPVTGSNEIVFVNQDEEDVYTIYIVIPGSDPVEIASFENRIHCTSFSSDGETILFLQSGEDIDAGIYSIPKEGGDVTLIANDDEWNGVIAAKGSPSRDVVIFVDTEEVDDVKYVRFNEISLAGGTPTVIKSFEKMSTDRITLDESHDGTMIACSASYPGLDGTDIILIPTGGGQEIPVTDFHDFKWHPHCPSWASDGSQLVIQLAHRSSLYRVDLKL